MMIPILLITDDKKNLKKYLKEKVVEKGTIFYEIIPEKKDYSIAEIKSIIKETNISNPEKRIYYLPNFHQSSLEAQNAFLKLLEEPPLRVQFILTTTNQAKLLPTIISRCKIEILGKKIISNKFPEINSALEKLIKNGDKQIFNLPILTKVEKDDWLTLLDEIIYFFKNRLENDPKVPKILKEIMKVRNLLENNNLSPQLSFDHILIFIMKTYTIKI